MGADPQAAGPGLQGQQWEMGEGIRLSQGTQLSAPLSTQAGTEDNGPRFQT